MQIDLGHLLDLLVPSILGAIAWFLRQLNTSIHRLTLAVAVGTTRINALEKRIDHLENNRCDK